MFKKSFSLFILVALLSSFVIKNIVKVSTVSSSHNQSELLVERGSGRDSEAPQKS